MNKATGTRQILMPPVSPKVRQWLLLGLVLVLYAVIFGRSVSFQFVWDDVDHIRENPVFDAPLLEGLATTQHGHMNPDYLKLTGIKPTHDSYRPLLFLSYCLDQSLFDRNPHWMHFHNLVIGLLALLAFYGLAKLWLGSANLALVAAAVFALHPLQVESTVYLSARSDLLAGLFGLLCALAVAHSAQPAESISRARRVCLVSVGILCFLCSLFCKEAYIGLPLALAAMLYPTGRLNRSKAALAGMLVAAAFFLVIRTAITEVGSQGFAQAIVALPGIFLHYLKLSVLPYDLSIQRMYHPAYLVPGLVAIPAVLIGSLVAISKGTSRIKSVTINLMSGLTWMAILIGPSAIVVVILGELSDRYVYLPLAGFAVALVATGQALIKRLPRFRPAVWVGAGIWAVLWLTITWLQVPTWRDNRTLYSHAVRMEPGSSMAVYRLGYTYLIEGKLATAEPMFRRALELDPDNFRAMNNLAVVWMRTRRYHQARDLLRRLIQASQNTHYRAWNNLATVHFALDEQEEGCRCLTRALAINPNYQLAWRAWDERCAGSTRP